MQLEVMWEFEIVTACNDSKASVDMCQLWEVKEAWRWLARVCWYRLKNKVFLWISSSHNLVDVFNWDVFFPLNDRTKGVFLRSVSSLKNIIFIKLLKFLIIMGPLAEIFVMDAAAVASIRQRVLPASALLPTCCQLTHNDRTADEKA